MTVQNPNQLVCDNCGQRECWEGLLMCEKAKRAGTCTLAEYQQLHGTGDSHAVPLSEQRDGFGGIA